MDSLLANYASSDEEEERSQPQNLPPNPPKPQQIVEQGPVSKSNGFLSSLPPPKSSNSSLSLFSSLPPPKSQNPNPSSSSANSIARKFDDGDEKEEDSKSSSSLFAFLPQPKSLSSSSSSSLFSSTPPNSSISSKRVVQFRPPPVGIVNNSGTDDEDDDEEEEKQKKRDDSLIQTSSVKSFLSSIPAPRSSVTLGALPSASGTGRRSILAAVNDSSAVATVSNEIRNVAGGTAQSYDNQSSVSLVGDPSDYSGYAGGGDYSTWGSGGEHNVSYDGSASYEGGGVDGNYDWGGGVGGYGNHGSGFGSSGDYVQYGSNLADGSNSGLMLAENAMRGKGKRGRNEVPKEIVEVSQDELMKDRPREDQTKLTGIAFGPSYQPASTKGKPSKLHKRKHQIGSLFFDMKQKEMELAERRAKGFLTKAQTQGKYGW